MPAAGTARRKSSPVHGRSIPAWVGYPFSSSSEPTRVDTDSVVRHGRLPGRLNSNLASQGQGVAGSSSFPSPWATGPAPCCRLGARGWCRTTVTSRLPSSWSSAPDAWRRDLRSEQRFPSRGWHPSPFPDAARRLQETPTFSTAAHLARVRRAGAVAREDGRGRPAAGVGWQTTWRCPGGDLERVEVQRHLERGALCPGPADPAAAGADQGVRRGHGGVGGGQEEAQDPAAEQPHRCRCPGRRVLGPPLRAAVLRPAARHGGRRRHRRPDRFAQRRRHRRQLHQQRPRPGHPRHLGPVRA